MASAISAQAEEKADRMVVEAKKIGTGMTWFGIGKQQKMEDAADLYNKAGAQYKIAKALDKAGHAYVEAAHYYEKAQNEPDALRAYTEAAKCYKLAGGDLEDRAAELYEICINKQMENNKFQVAAKMWKELGEMYETDNKEKAMHAYEQAAECFGMSDAKTNKHQCLLKVADFAADEGDYKRAIQIYEEVSMASLDNNLTKWSVSQYQFKALLCSLALQASVNDISKTRELLDNYIQLNPQFDRSREAVLIASVVDAFEEQNAEKYTNAVADYDTIAPLDRWKSSILLNVKKAIKKSVVSSHLDTTGGVDLS